MLSHLERRYIEICTYKVQSNEPNRKIADLFDVTERTIDRALAWGRKHNFFLKQSTDKLQIHMSEIHKQIEWLEAELKVARSNTKLKDKSGKTIRIPMPAKHINAISRELRNCRTLLMELEGIYKQTLNLSVNADDKLMEKLKGIRKKRRGDAADRDSD